ncbi:MAG: thermonuclease family protein [Bacillota bacterium]
MSFIAIKGTFHVTGYSPDGDSIRFMAQREENWGLLKGPHVKQNAKKHVQLRFEGIDTLETHYKGFHQPKEFAEKATDFLLKQLNIKNIVWNRSRVERADDGTEGYILTRTTEQNRRPVAFVFSNNVNFSDGESVYLDVKLIKKSINYKLVREGLAYCTFYKGLFYDLREALTKAAYKAREENKGFWPLDKTTLGVEVTGRQALEEEHIILPKLFRRVMSYLENGGDMSGFIEYLKTDPEAVFILSNSHFTHFHNVVFLEDNTVKLTANPEDLIFLD